MLLSLLLSSLLYSQGMCPQKLSLQVLRPRFSCCLREWSKKRILPEDIARSVLEGQKRRRGKGQHSVAKRAYIDWNRECARACVEEDYWGLHLRFRDCECERVLQISMIQAKSLMTLLGNAHPYFRNTVDCRGQRCICPKVKFIMALKLVCSWCFPCCFGAVDWAALLGDSEIERR